MVVSKRLNNKIVNEPVSTQDLQKQVAELSKQLQLLLANKQQIAETPQEHTTNELNSNDRIKVISLCDHELNLSTESKGRGKLFTFKRFGEVKKIPYGYLVDIMENHANFLNQGRFMIMDDRVIREHALEEAYEKILNKENFEKILSGNDTDAITLFKNANESQRELVIQMFLRKAVNNEDVDFNLLDRMSKIVGYNITEKIESAKETKLMLEEYENSKK